MPTSSLKLGFLKGFSIGWLLLSATTSHSNLVDFQKELASLQVIEDDSRYWEAVSSAVAVGWLDVAIENGLVEAVAVLIINMPRLHRELAAEKISECRKTKHDFVKAWEKWQGQLTKLQCSAFWVQWDHLKTREGLKSLLQIMLGNLDVLSFATCNWIELLISQLLYVRPLTMGLESLYSLAKKCMQSKLMSSSHKLMRLFIGILGKNTETVEICRMYELDSVASKIRKQWEGLIELLGAESRTVGGLKFLHKYMDFKKSIQQVHDGLATDSARKAAESLILLMKNPSTPQRFWLPLLYDSMKLNWKQGPILNASQTNLLLNKLQELSMARLRPDFVEPQLPSEALSSIRLALANNLGRAILEE